MLGYESISSTVTADHLDIPSVAEKASMHGRHLSSVVRGDSGLQRRMLINVGLRVNKETLLRREIGVRSAHHCLRQGV
jgi:hypothetical protein